MAKEFRLRMGNQIFTTRGNPDDYVTNAELTQILLDYVLKTRTINGKPLSNDIVLKLSDLANDTNYQNKDEVIALIDEAIADVEGLEFRPVDSLPATGEKGVIYLVPNGTTGSNVKDEYVWITSENRFEKIGSTELDLEGYVTEQELQTILNDYVTNTELRTILEDFYTKTDIDTKFEDYYTKTEVDTKLDDYVEKTELDDYYKKTETYSQTEVDTKLDDYYKKTETYSQTEVDTKLDDYYKKTETYSQTEVDTKLDDYYTKTETYSQTEVDTELDKKIDDPATKSDGQALLYDETEDKWVAGDVESVPSGGSKGQVLGKKSATDGDVEWVDRAVEMELTQAEYDALTEEEKTNGTIYFITDAEGGGGGGSYVLPVASANTLGGVKVGSNLSIDENGVLSSTGGASEDAIAALANRGWKNFVPYKILKIGSSGGISVSFPEYISPDAEHLQVSGQASTDVNIVISEKFELNKGNYILSGLGNSYWADASADTYYLELVDSGTVIATYPQSPEFSIADYGFNLELRFVVKAMPNDKWFDSDADGSIIFPMIRDASISDPTYVAPSLGLRELSELVKNAATGKDANIRGTDSTIRVTNVTNREVSILADTTAKKITVTSAKAGETPARFEFGITSAYGIIRPTVSGFGGDVRYQSKNGYATITGTLINSTVPLTQRVETKFAELPATLKPTYEINAPISHHDQATASTLRIKSNGDLCIYPPINIPQGTAMFMCVTYPIEN